MVLFQLLDDDSDERSRDDTWMNSNQFKALLDKQESEVVRQSSDDVDFLNKTTQLTDNDNDNDNEDSGCSYLDQEAKIPFRKLKQVRLDLLCRLLFLIV